MRISGSLVGATALFLMTIGVCAEEMPGSTALVYDFTTGEEELRVLDPGAAPAEWRTPHVEGEAIDLPADAAPLTRLRSNSIVTVRARDVFDINHYPASAVAKMFQLDADGARTGQSCTAQFIGPRFLITAAHCLFDSGEFRPGQELEIHYDAGEGDREPVPVIRAWLRNEDLVQFRGTATEVLAWVEDPVCVDFGIVEIEEPLGDELGWFGIENLTDFDDAELLHDFSYPQRSRTEMLEHTLATDETLPPPVREAFERTLEEMRPHNPDFSNQNLYYSYGAPDDVESDAIYVAVPYSLAGVSGGALFTPDFRIAGIRSTWAESYARYCRPSGTWMSFAEQVFSLAD